VGPYDLQDFFLHHLIRRGGKPGKVLRLAEYVYGDEYDHETLVKWLRSYYVRLFLPAVQAFLHRGRARRRRPDFFPAGRA
jgi:hypothetical protein